MRNSTKKGGTAKKKYQVGGVTPMSTDPWEPQLATYRDAYNRENVATTKNKTNARGRNVRKTKATNYLVPGKLIVINDTDPEELRRQKMNYLYDTSNEQKTGTQKTRTVTNPKKNTVKTVTKSTGSYIKDGKKKRVVTKSKYGLKMASGGAVIASPIQTRLGNKPVAGGNMAKGGQKFPDLTGDGKVTKADVLKGRGVFKKGGQKHPGFNAVQAKIAAKSGVSKKAAGAILASATRKASAKAKAANPRLKRVKG
jgi:hypothetical protein